ncbi:hypothetical protein CC86DRAFT_289927 [Ophiobolus disseminans]|uniref:Uncharacterized protein n=1 Tax=Ophiobolus disseminans TaxID=1469910 RepID=A0A6A7A5F5_9PLEO|nr:hypothetical protein CC86DRAFT_289927 [Ophiobolus disseminans]
MAPVEPDAHARNNLFAYAPFGGQIALVIGLTAHVLLIARRAAKSLPPTTATRSQQPLRRNYAILFSLLAALSLASVTTFAVLWRAGSYMQWARAGDVEPPNGIWSGPYGSDGRWYLGDWIYDIDLRKVSDSVAVSTPAGFLYTSQHFIGLMASAIFFGAEGHRRNLRPSTIASFVVLGATGSLGYALSLFFVTILYTPLTLHRDDTPLHDALFVPSPLVYYVPIAISLSVLNGLPTILTLKMDPRILSAIRFGNIAVPLFLAFAPQIMPVSLGRQHTSKTAAHRSYAKTFYFLSVAAFMLYWRVFYTNVSANTPQQHHTAWDVFTDITNKVGLTDEKPRSNRILAGISNTARRVKHISAHPIISVTSLDVLFTTISLLAWTFTRNLDVDAILENSVLSFLVPKHEKHVAFEDEVKRLPDLHSEPEPEPVVETTTPRKRGRPAKNRAAVNGTTAPATASVRRSTRRGTRSVDLDSDTESITTARKLHVDYESDGESAYQPSASTKRAVAETEADGATGELDVVHGGESTALALFLTFAGGLGGLAAGALGAEVTGPQE